MDILQIGYNRCTIKAQRKCDHRNAQYGIVTDIAECK